MAQNDHLMINLVNWIRERGLELPAILFLQAGKPLAPIGGQMLLFFQPILGALGSMLGWPGSERIWADYASLLENPADIERILELMEKPA